MTGWADRPPAGPWGAYTDFIAPRFGVAALVSALYERARSGRGQHIDLAQVEAALRFLEPVMLDYFVNGRIAGPAGHDSATCCPHGVYRAAGTERYVAIAVEDAAQWRALCACLSLAGLDDPAVSQPGREGYLARLARRTEIDAALREACARREPFALAEGLRAAGVPASVVFRPIDLYEDRQLVHRGFFVELEHSVMGLTAYDGLVTHFSATPGRLHKAAPALGEDSFRVLKEILGLGPEEIARYAEEGVLS